MATNIAEETGKTRSKERTPDLDKYGKDLTSLAENGALDPIIGRNKEIERCCQILGLKKKNNPILIGEPGAGKSQIVYGIAQKIASKEVPKLLLNKRIIQLDLTAVVAGTTYRGDFEARIKNIMDDCLRAKNIILFIDEIHTMVGAGSAAGSMDAANILKPALADGSIQVIGATTLDEYRRHIEDDKALTRRFHSVLVDPTSVEDTIEILKGLKSTYEKHHDVTYTDEAIVACVTLSDRYITTKVLPDKAIDVLDEAGSRVNSNFAALAQQNVPLPDGIQKMYDKFEELEKVKKSRLKKQDYESVIDLRPEMETLKARIDDARDAWEQSLRNKVINVASIEEIVEMSTGIPVSKMKESDLKELQAMQPTLQASVIGQDIAVDEVVKVFRRARFGLKKKNRPNSLIFVGPTGVGKTHLARGLAKFIFGSDDNFFKFDMSEYQEKFTISRLIGAPPGYVGYQEGGQLTEKIRRKPWAVVLLDEIEKAHPDIYNVLLQALEDGELTDGLGRKCSLKNVIIIMTSNVGAKKVRDFGTGVGFTTKAKAEAETEIKQAVLRKELFNKFPAEFVNRIDGVVYFNDLDKPSINKIAKIELNEAIERINAQGVEVVYDDKVLDFIGEKGYTQEFGARELYRTIQKYVEDKVAKELTFETLKAGDTVTLVAQKDQIDLEINKQEP